MKKIATIIAALAVLPAAAQNYNPTVVVTNTYVGHPSDVTKPVVEMAVPDSLLRFDLKFDYDVFEQKYAGADDFAPYLMDMRPDVRFTGGRKLYVKAGAGWGLHPELDVLYTPVRKEGRENAFYLSHRSYLGDYRSISGDGGVLRKDGGVHWGFDGKTSAGYAARATRETYESRYYAGYYGLYNKYSVSKSAVNAVDGGYRYISRRNENVLRSAGINTKIGLSTYKNLAGSIVNSPMVELGFDAAFGRDFSGNGGLAVDVEGQINCYFSESTGLGAVAVTPKYVWRNERFHTSLGLRLSGVMGSETSKPDGENLLGTLKSQIVYPAVYVDYDLVPEHLNVRASLTGGDSFLSLTAMKELSPFVDLAHTTEGFFGNSIERVNVNAGLNGSFLSKYRFDLSGGFALYGNGRLESVSAGLPAFVYEDYEVAYANLRFEASAKPVLVDGVLSGRYFISDTKDWIGFAPASLSGNVRVRYNWKDRIIAGIYTDFATARKSSIAEIPGYVNLGIEGEYAFTKKLSGWLRIDNLLNQTIQRHPLIAERGISATAGIIWNF